MYISEEPRFYCWRIAPQFVYFRRQRSYIRTFPPDNLHLLLDLADTFAVLLVSINAEAFFQYSEHAALLLSQLGVERFAGFPPVAIVANYFIRRELYQK